MNAAGYLKPLNIHLHFVVVLSHQLGYTGLWLTCYFVNQDSDSFTLFQCHRVMASS